MICELRQRNLSWILLWGQCGVRTHLKKASATDGWLWFCTSHPRRGWGTWTWSQRRMAAHGSWLTATSGQDRMWTSVADGGATSCNQWSVETSKIMKPDNGNSFEYLKWTLDLTKGLVSGVVWKLKWIYIDALETPERKENVSTLKPNEPKRLPCRNKLSFYFICFSKLKTSQKSDTTTKSIHLLSKDDFPKKMVRF